MLMDTTKAANRNRNMQPETTRSALISSSRLPHTSARTLGALAVGGLAVGVLAVGVLAIGRLVVGHARIRRLDIDELVVRKLRITESVETAGRAKARDESMS